MKLNVGAATDVGQLRSLNEDSYSVAPDVVAVADGMGGHNGGEIASALALATFESALTGRSLEEVGAAALAANRAVHDHATSDAALAGMGTTLCTVSVAGPDQVVVSNVGDSRVYLLRAGHLFQVTEDHSFVETLVREGRLTRAQAEVHPQKNVITRALGPEAHVEVDAWLLDVEDGDRFLLCSDGLTNEVPETTIEDTLTDLSDPVEVCGRLITLANIGGGRDNITVVVADVSDSGRATGTLDSMGRPIDRADQRAHIGSGGTQVTEDRPHYAASPVGAAPSDAASSDAAGVGAGAGVSNPVIDAPTLPSTPAAESTPPKPKRRRFTWRTLVFVLAIVVVFSAALFATDWFYKNTYSVAEKDGDVVIWRGPRDSNLLWWHPEVVNPDEGLKVSELPRQAQDEVNAGKDMDSLSEARAYVNRLRDLTTTTTTTTTTTAPPETVPPETVPPQTEVPPTATPQPAPPVDPATGAAPTQ